MTAVQFQPDDERELSSNRLEFALIALGALFVLIALVASALL